MPSLVPSSVLGIGAGYGADKSDLFLLGVYIQTPGRGVSYHQRGVPGSTGTLYQSPIEIILVSMEAGCLCLLP